MDMIGSFITYNIRIKLIALLISLLAVSQTAAPYKGELAMMTGKPEIGNATTILCPEDDDRWRNVSFRYIPGAEETSIPDATVSWYWSEADMNAGTNAIDTQTGPISTLNVSFSKADINPDDLPKDMSRQMFTKIHFTESGEEVTQSITITERYVGETYVTLDPFCEGDAGIVTTKLLLYSADKYRWYDATGTTSLKLLNIIFGANSLPPGQHHYTLKTNREGCNSVGTDVVMTVIGNNPPTVNGFVAAYDPSSVEDGHYMRNPLEQYSAANDGAPFITPISDEVCKLNFYDTGGKLISDPNDLTPEVPSAPGKRMTSYTVTQKCGKCSESNPATFFIITYAMPKPTGRDYIICEGETEGPWLFDFVINTIDQELNNGLPDDETNYCIGLASKPDFSDEKRSEYGDARIEMMMPDLEAGEHTFYMRQVDLLGYTSDASTFTITVVRPDAPSLAETATDICLSDNEIPTLATTTALGTLTWEMADGTPITDASTLASATPQVETIYARQTVNYPTTFGPKGCVSDRAPYEIRKHTLELDTKYDHERCEEGEIEIEVSARTISSDLSISILDAKGTDIVSFSDATSTAGAGEKLYGYTSTEKFTVTASSGTCHISTTYDDISVITPIVSGRYTIRDAIDASTEMEIAIGAERAPFTACSGKAIISFDADRTSDDITVYPRSSAITAAAGAASTSGIEITAEGTGSIRVNYENQCKTSTTIDIISPNTTSSLSVLSSTACIGDVATVEAYVEEGASVEWRKGETIVSNEPKLIIRDISAADEGEYTYTVTNKGCSAPGSKTYTLTAGGKLDGTITFHDLGAYAGADKSLPIDSRIYSHTTCAEEVTVTVQTDLTDSEVTIRDGKLGTTLPVNVEARSFSFTALRGHTYTTEYQSICDVSLSISIVGPIVSASLVSTEAHICQDAEARIELQTEGSCTIQWLHDDVEVSTERTLSIPHAKPSDSGTYTYIYSADGCHFRGEDSYQLTVDSDGIAEATADETALCEGEGAVITLSCQDCETETRYGWASHEGLSPRGEGKVADFTASELAIDGTLSHGYQGSASLYFWSQSGVCERRSGTISIDLELQPTASITGEDALCEDSPVALSATEISGATYAWSSSDGQADGLTTAAISVRPSAATTSYRCDITRGLCTISVQREVHAGALPRIADIDTSEVRTACITVLYDGTARLYCSADDREPIEIESREICLERLSCSSHEVIVRDEAGCADTATFAIDCPEIEIMTHITPNGDGVDDLFLIPERFSADPETELRIYDRYGKLLTLIHGGQGTAGWDGTYQGHEMPSTDYWYELRLGPLWEIYTGHFTLLRGKK